MITSPPIAAWRFPAMGSMADVMIVGPAPTELAAWARTRIEQLEMSWSRFLPESELNAIVRRAGSGPVAASPDMIAAIGHALELWYVTEGRFDATIRSALEACGYDRTFREISPDTGAAPRPVPAPGCAAVRLDRDRGTVTVPAGSSIDLGGIGKGLAADMVATGLVERGAWGACVALGGDVRVAGSAPVGDAWPIPIEDPRDASRTMGRRMLADAAIVTSTTKIRTWTRGQATMHHLIDPSVGLPARTGVIAVVAQAETAWWAEGVAKAALIAGPEDGLALLERLGVAAMIVGDDGSVSSTSRWEAA